MEEDKIDRETCDFMSAYESLHSLEARTDLVLDSPLAHCCYQALILERPFSLEMEDWLVRRIGGIVATGNVVPSLAK